MTSRSSPCMPSGRSTTSSCFCQSSWWISDAAVEEAFPEAFPAVGPSRVLAVEGDYPVLGLDSVVEALRQGLVVITPLLVHLGELIEHAGDLGRGEDRA